MLITHCTVNMFTDCDFPQGYNYAVFLYLLMLIVLFGNFYIKSYGTGRAKKRDPNILIGNSKDSISDNDNDKETVFVRKTVQTN